LPRRKKSSRKQKRHALTPHSQSSADGVTPCGHAVARGSVPFVAAQAQLGDAVMGEQFCHGVRVEHAFRREREARSRRR